VGDESTIICGCLPRQRGEDVSSRIHLSLLGKDPNVHLRVSDITDRLVKSIQPLYLDLLEIAAYVYAADQSLKRGGDSAVDFGDTWRRALRFKIPVRKPEVWSSKSLVGELCDLLCLVSDDREYSFEFSKLQEPPPLAQYFEFQEACGKTWSAPDEVVLFSGGLDSLGGAVEETIRAKRKACLVCHRPSPKHAAWQNTLATELEKELKRNAFLVHVWCNKEKHLGKEFTQRTRSFLYASIAAVVARMSKLSRIRFYENGITSINLPISAQLVGAKASRTTHPGVLKALSKFFSLLFEESFSVENPFVWLTKAEVVQRIREAGCGRLIKHTVSCVHPWERTRLRTHCGECFQCVVRRFATLAGGASSEEDPEEMYGIEVLKGSRESLEGMTTGESWIRAARRIKAMSDGEFFSEYGEVTRVLPHLGLSANEGATRILDLHRRHAAQVCEVLRRGIQEHASEISQGAMPATCLLVQAFVPEIPEESPGKVRMPRQATIAEHEAGESSPPVELLGEGRPVRLFGKEKPPLTVAQYDVVKALIEAGPRGLTKDELELKSGRGGARKTLRLLLDDPDWSRVVAMAGKTGQRYRIMNLKS
jgi:hypothetical protein